MSPFYSCNLWKVSLKAYYFRTADIGGQSEITMVRINISGLLYAIVTSAIVWFLLWFAYDVFKISQFLGVGAFINLDVTICLIVFLTLVWALGGIERA